MVDPTRTAAADCNMVRRGMGCRNGDSIMAVSALRKFPGYFRGPEDDWDFSSAVVTDKRIPGENRILEHAPAAGYD